MNNLSEGIVKACIFFNLKLPAELNFNMPSDYFGENISLDFNKLRRTSKLSKEKFIKLYDDFNKKYSSQKNLKQNETDLNIYFCDFLLFARKNDAAVEDYFDFEFYKKSSEEQKTFRLQIHRRQTKFLCNDYYACKFLDNKTVTNKLYADFIHRDWLNTQICTFEEFKNFTEKHSRFFAKPVGGSFGKGANIVQITSAENLEQIFNTLKNNRRLVEEVISQHESLKEFCPDTVNTLRINTFLDIHDNVHILTVGGRFGRVGKVVDNFHGGGFSVIIDSKTGVIVSDGINKVHERTDKHPDTGKIFKGFQYPFWDKICNTVEKMAKVVPNLHHIGWDIAINSKGEVELVEANANPDVDVQQAPDAVGRLYLYQPLIEEFTNYKDEQLKILGYKINNLPDFDSAYENFQSRQNERIKNIVENLIPDCKSVLDIGCRQDKFIKNFCAEDIKYYPVDFKNYDDEEIIACDFNKDEFPDIKADTCICALTAEFVKDLPTFLKNICNSAQKQILMLCRPADKEIHKRYRWKNPVLTDFTEDFLIKTMQENNFKLHMMKTDLNNSAIIMYDFRKN